MDGDGSKVQVYIYDVTKGLAAQLSPMFLGKGSYAFCMPYSCALSPGPLGGGDWGRGYVCVWSNDLLTTIFYR